MFDSMKGMILRKWVLALCILGAETLQASPVSTPPHKPARCASTLRKLAILGVVTVGSLAIGGLGYKSHIDKNSQRIIPYFNSDDFVKKLAPFEFPTDINQRVKAIKDFLLNEKSSSSWIDKKMNYAQFGHSIGLVSRQKLAPFLPDGWQNQETPITSAMTYVNQREVFAPIDLKNEELSLFKNSYRTTSKNIHEVEQYYSSAFSNSKDLDLRRATHKAASPLVDWMLDQENHSISHVALLNKALQIYQNDLGIALGVIGEIFNSEREFAHPRKLKAIFANKLIPLFPDNNIDHVGTNYHFWTHVNLAVSGEDFGAKLGNYALEGNDMVDFKANQLGLEVGKALIPKNNKKP